MTSNGDDALSVKWCFGFNKDVAGGVVNLSVGNHRRLAYAAGHMVVIYDIRKHEQRHLLGHSSKVTALCVSADRRWLISADGGADSLLVVWDTTTGEPVKTIARPHVDGVQAVAVSGDAMFLATLGLDAEHQQQLAVWDWTVDRDHTGAPLLQRDVPVGGPHTCVRFDPADSSRLVSSGATRVVLWSWGLDRLDFVAPVLSARALGKTPSGLSMCTFSCMEREALVSTVDGDLIVLEESPGEDGALSTWNAIKCVHVHDAPITALEVINEYVACGDAKGFVRFFDAKLRLVSWFEDLEAGPVTSISFAEKGGVAHPGATFIVPDFTVGTSNALVVWLKSYMAEEVDVEYRRGELVMQGMDAGVHGLSCNPVRSEFACTTAGGCVQVWDYDELRLVMMKVIDKHAPCCVSYSRNGNLLAVGFADGLVKLLDAENLDERHSVPTGKHGVRLLQFSPDSRMLAFADDDGCVGLLRVEKPRTMSGEVPGAEADWQYIGRARVHTRGIVSIDWLPPADAQSAPRLISVGRDCMLFEIDCAASSIERGLAIKSKMQVDQLGVPTCALWMPGCEHGEPVAIVANDQYKFRIMNVNSGVFRRMALAPTYGGPVTRCSVVPRTGNGFMAYATSDKVVGLAKLPLDGNPCRSMGVIAHTGAVERIDCSLDGRLLLTAGGDDCIVNLFDIHTSAIDKLVEAGGDGISPFVPLIDGGLDGALMQEIADYFLFAQVRHQGESSKQPYSVGRSCPVDAVPDVMRALGFYPSEREAQDLVTELKYTGFLESGEARDRVEFEDLVRAYINHRPVLGVGQAEIADAFAKLGAAKGSGLLDRDTLLRELSAGGERITRDELARLLEALTGDREVTALPERVTSAQFASDVLGFDEDAGSGSAAGVGAGV